MCKHPIRENKDAVRVTAEQPTNKEKFQKKSAPVQHSIERSGWTDVAIFLAPVLMSRVTNVLPIYITAFSRIFATRLFLSLHYMFVDKDNYNNKISESQLNREKKDYLVATMLHMWTQAVLQVIFPGMFFASNDQIGSCGWNTFLSHIALVEPLYYATHLWLHKPNVMKYMHSFHHLSVKTLPSTALVQDFKEHFVYITIFGPAFLVPFIFTGQNHWVVICAYLVLFDVINMFGHTNIAIQSPIFNSKWSPMRYLFYTPEFHLGHHNYFSANYGLFMPFWDHLFGTYREYTIAKRAKPLLPKDQQDFVFIGHCGGLGHILTCPEFCVYNVYDEYIRTWLPLQVEILFMDFVTFICRMFIRSYKVSRYIVDERRIGRIICIIRSPMDYINQKRHAGVNKDLVQLMEDEHKAHGTRFFGLGNLNKMKQLNEGGEEIARLVSENEYLRDKNVRIWTGDTMTSASVFNQIISIPQVDKVFYIGAGGKIGQAVIRLLAARNIKVKVFSKHPAFQHPNIEYTQDLTEMANYRHIVIGKILNQKLYQSAFNTIKERGIQYQTRFLLDYTVPFIPINLSQDIVHLQIGVLSVGAKEDSSSPVLRGHFDVCMGHSENEIYPCHAGCILNMLRQRETNETGDIVVDEIPTMWEFATSLGLNNRKPRVPID